MALADNRIKKEEFQTMKNEISSLRTHEKLNITDAHIDIEALVITTFKVLYFDKATVEDCYNDFINFKRKHESLFTKEIKRTILKIAGKIAGSFSDVNKSELILLAKLSIEFKDK
jgi:hypothetical protein